MRQCIFEIEKQIEYGQGFYFISSQQGWDLNRAIRLDCINPSKWSTTVSIEVPKCEYKYIIGDFMHLMNNSVMWEQGPNRVVMGNKSRPSSLRKMLTPKVHKDRWEQRAIMIILAGQKLNSKVFVFSNYRRMATSQQMKLGKYSHYYFYYAQQYIDLDEITKVTDLQYYIVEYGQVIKEFISKPIKTTYDPKNCIMFTVLPNEIENKHQ